MYSKKATTLAFLSLLLIIKLAHADLPVHCVMHQVLGEWKIQLAEPHNSTEISKKSCGHETPDRAFTSWNSGLEDFEAFSEMVVTLNRNNTVSIDGKPNAGNWTMIYDEALEIILEDQRFMSFFYYSPKQDKDFYDDRNYQSNCSRTTVGWWTSEDGQSACFQAWKLNVTADDDDSVEAPLARYIVQPKETQSESLQTLVAQNTNNKRNRVLTERVHFSRNFKNHDKAVHMLNLVEKKNWKAKTHSRFEGMSVKELNKFAGRKATVKAQKSVSQMYEQNDISDLPASHSWKDYLGEVREQGDCGSCYLVSTLQMLEARLKIKHNETVKLSVQHPLDCSYYNQGCDGGYPYLVEKFAREFSLMSEDDCPYVGTETACGNCDPAKASKVYKTTDYRFVGGAYGLSNERNMMLEILNNGPIVVSFEPGYDFMHYNNGVYHSVEAAEWLINGEEKPEWEKVDHSVLCYGWGITDDGEKYWLLRNSWGTTWGEEGDFKLRRGTDESAVESLAEAADPIVIHQ